MYNIQVKVFIWLCSSAARVKQNMSFRNIHGGIGIIQYNAISISISNRKQNVLRYVLNAM